METRPRRGGVGSARNGLAEGNERMRIVTWNLGFWQYRAHHDAAWRYLRETLRPDLALLQEVREVSLVEGESRVYRQAWRSWGTAVLARNLRLEPIEIAVDLEGRTGYVVGARCHGEGVAPFVAVSLHAPILHGVVVPYLDRILTAVEGAVQGQRFVVGGDLNSGRLAEQLWPGYGHGGFWSRVDRGAFVDCHQRIHRREQRTILRGNADLQDDHLFVSDDLAASLRTCDVVSDPAIRTLSDHLPLVADVAV